MPLFAFGSNGSGQLGAGHTEDISLPERCVFDDDPPSSTNPSREENGVLRIAAGGNHTVVLFRDGSAYAAGLNEDGRCGVPASGPEEAAVCRFRRVVVVDPDTGGAVERFRDVAATWEATVLVASVPGMGVDGVFVMGSGAKGELGVGGRTRVESPVRMAGFPPRGTRVLGVGSGMGHSVVVLASGEVYGWGAARKGQLGEGVRERKVIWEPVRVEGIPFGATGAVCGREFTVVMGDREAGEFVVLGSADNKWGIVSDVPAPGLLAGYVGIYASWHGVCVHRCDSSVICWGRDDRGQLPPLGLPKPKELAIGSEHGLALLDDGTVVAFGWGEHGNCGPDTDAQGNVKGYNTIPLVIGEGTVVGIAAGCATSWIITT